MTAIRRFTSAFLTAIGLLSLATIAVASSPAPIAELFSTPDGNLQFIQLSNVTADELAGKYLTSTYGGITKIFVFPVRSQLPDPPVTDQMLIVSQSLSALPHGSSPGWAEEWDYVMPDGFLPLSNGSVSLGDIDQWDYGSIPADGFSALYRSGEIGVYSANSSAHGVVVVFGSAEERFVSEYVSDSFTRHFFTALEPEVAALDSGQIPGWHGVGQDFPGYTTFGGFSRSVEALSHPLCRFYFPPPGDSHFFTASEEECVTLKLRDPRFILETNNVFYVGLPDPVTGQCAPGLGPLYRLWNPATSDHWYTADPVIDQAALAQGYIPESYMCVLLACTGAC